MPASQSESASDFPGATDTPIMDAAIRIRTTVTTGRRFILGRHFIGLTDTAIIILTAITAIIGIGVERGEFFGPAGEIPSALFFRRA